MPAIGLSGDWGARQYDSKCYYPGAISSYLYNPLIAFLPRVAGTRRYALMGPDPVD